MELNFFPLHNSATDPGRPQSKMLKALTQVWALEDSFYHFTLEAFLALPYSFSLLIPKRRRVHRKIKQRQMVRQRILQNRLDDVRCQRG